MLDTLKELFKGELQFQHTAALIQQAGQLINVVNAQYMKDAESGKNTAIDLLCQLLQAHKDGVPLAIDVPVCSEALANATN